MCLAVPAKVIQLSGERAVADLHGNHVTISTMLTPNAQLGDWVLVHAGFAIQILDPEAAMETFAILADVEAAMAEAAEPPPRGGSHA